MPCGHDGIILKIFSLYLHAKLQIMGFHFISNEFIYFQVTITTFLVQPSCRTATSLSRHLETRPSNSGQWQLGELNGRSDDNDPNYDGVSLKSHHLTVWVATTKASSSFIFENIHCFHASLVLDVCPIWSTSTTFPRIVNIVHSSCRPSNFISFFTHFPQVFLHLHLFI